MESHIRYLDELILAIEGTEFITKDEYFTYPPNINLNDDTKYIKIIKTLLKNLKESPDTSSMINDKVFSKSIIVLDILFQKKPYLLVCSDLLDKNLLTIISLIDEFLIVSNLNYAIRHRQWFIRKKVGSWCKLTTILFGRQCKNKISEHFQATLASVEREIKGVLMNQCETAIFYSQIARMWTLLYWLNSPREIFGSCLLFLDSSTGLCKWNFEFQRLIRIIFFVFDSIKIESQQCLNLQLDYLSLLVLSLSDKSMMNEKKKLTIISTCELKYVLSIMHHILERPRHILPNNASFAKSILRVYLLCISSDSFDSLLYTFISNFSIEHWIKHDTLELRKDNAADLPLSFDIFTNKALLLIYFDIQRRTASSGELEYNEKYSIWCSRSSQTTSLIEMATTPFPGNEKQIEKIRILILESFHKNKKYSILNSELNVLSPGMTKRTSNNPRLLFNEISVSIQTCLTTNNTSRLVDNIKILANLTCFENSNREGLADWNTCQLCDSVGSCNIFERIDPDRNISAAASPALTILNKYLLLPEYTNKYNDSVLASILLCLQRIFMHYQPPKLDHEELQLGSSLFRFFTLCFKHPKRYIRLLSSRLLPLWNLTTLDINRDQQTATLIKFLQANNEENLTEVWVISWTQLTLTTSGEVFDSLLLKLFDIFSSKKYALFSMMAVQIKIMAFMLHKTPYTLLSPILPILLRQLGKNLVEKKNTFYRLINLLGYSAKTILGMFQRYIVPYAITQYRTDVFSEVAKIMCDCDPTLLLEEKKTLLSKNSRYIFAVALVKHGFFSLETLETLFLNRVPSFDKNYITAYLPDYKTLAEVVKLYKNSEGSEPEFVENEKSVLAALRFLLINFTTGKHLLPRYKPNSNSEWSIEQEECFQRNLLQNILGIFQVFSSDIHDVGGRTTYYEKLRVVNGISFLIKYASKKAIISALAQISICLQTGLEICEVRYSALRCWYLLIENLNDEELSTIIDAFIAYILQQWSQFDSKTKTIVYEILDVLVKTKSDLTVVLKPYISVALAGSAQVDILSRDGAFARIIHKIKIISIWFRFFSKNLESNNKYIIHQNLNDLELHLRKQNERITNRWMGNTDLSMLLEALLRTSQKFRTIDDELCKKSARCIGLIGTFDITKNKFNERKSVGDEIFDFNNDVETIKFLIWVINDILVPAFWQSENPSKQLFVALVLQESLKYCGLSSDSWDINKRELFPNEWILWNKFNTISKTTLYPLLSSLYLAQSWKEYVPLQYPSFKIEDGYRSWIKSFTLDLLKTGTDETHPLHVFSSLIREDDGSLSNFLLPYIITVIIVKEETGSSSSDLMNNIIMEFKFIFGFSTAGLNHLQLDSLKMCYESIFKVLEYVRKWITNFRQKYHESNGTSIIREEKTLKMLKKVEEFLHSIEPELLARRSLETNSFERSALFLEQCYRENGKNLGNTELLCNLQKTYEEIGDVDSIDGILKSFSTGNLISKIEELQYSKSWSMAQDCFSALSGISDDTAIATRMVKTLYNHQLYSQVLAKLPACVNKSYTAAREMKEWYKMGLSAANVEGNISLLKEWIHRVEILKDVNDPEINLEYNISKSLNAVASGDLHKTKKYIDQCFALIGTHLTAASSGTTLVKKQNLVMKLHSLYDILLLSEKDNEYQYHDAISVLDFRMRNIKAAFEPNHYLLSIRKSFGLLHKQEYSKKELINTFFEITQLCRMNSRLDIACESLMFCLENGHSQAELEFAEILWKQGENDRALKLVEEIHQRFGRKQDVKKRDRSAVLLKYTEWLDLSNNSASEQIIKQYKEIFILDPTWDKPYYSIGQYFARLLERKIAEGYITDGQLEYKSVSYFLLAFEKNSIKVRENLPKVITFWLDIASDSMKASLQSEKEILQTTTKDICKCIEGALPQCPTYIWYSVLTQLLSRLLHTHRGSSKLIMKILLMLTVEYPAHLLWYISGLLNSSSKPRVIVGQHIIEKYRHHRSQVSALVDDSSKLTAALTKVCLQDVKNISSRSGRSLEKDFNFDVKMVPSNMTVPVRINLEMLSPLSADSMDLYVPFGEPVTISSFGSSYKVFASLKRPKKLNMIGSNGHIYGIMCKKEDVRQDNQYMQFATTMDFLLSKDVESMKRYLGITTYSVLSLREDCGLIEIVPNVITLRSIFVTKYEGMKVKYNLKSLYESWQNTSPGQRIGFYKEQLLKFPPVLYEWFLDTFPDPINWFNARNRYARSYAVMGMVGYILGLGDRHCENILLDVESGNVLHVDFDCLFEKGKRLPIPEIVPFRLTQNLYDALGITGTDGTFKKTSEVTLSLMRDNEVALMNVIETIMYDRNLDDTIQRALKVIRNKIRGIDPRDELILSVPGQVDTLIQESTTDDNLGKMYIGWLPFW
ncbi:protein kinase MEC1 NDAI_0A06590 [Naumovozyma dairenensis CBS 421]|uniref:Serine/threonine-protein kinase MEC1 n=1 Tax=Naumovozyma dairenensis (strain ATCC 10597 / BCRC 20456 / CBS 421 / NBRC 0211 / NRRL Y-12639) TaxID=1071378 RepID=G0W4S5_NAUDC|nr:hypothetical protein NDAI_0A06590 [Naumovozyma dairenensis CBS 421]CCD22813.1 hypothetical protein NDAI_0A06590 [Naumovozyma dairenensis CBS 421]